MLAIKFFNKKNNVPSSGVERSLLLGVLLFFLSCSTENAPDCFQTAGNRVRIEVDVDDFSTITVFENLNLVLKQGDIQKVEIESGENLINEISANVEDDRLILMNTNDCNYVRDYGISTIYVTAPNLNEVRSSTGLLVSSDGVLNYPSLRLISESFTEPEAETTDGSFDLDLNSQTLTIVVNGISFFRLSGQVLNFNLNLAAGDSRIEAQNLLAQNVTINHRGTNDVLVNPQQRISGIISGYGNVISFNRPPEIAVEEIFNGRLIFRD